MIMKLLDHPNIIRMISHHETESSINIVLDIAENGCMYFYIHPRRGLPEDLALRFFFQVLSAVSYLHERGIAHRDIKPENILLDDKFEVRLCDFGWACVLSDALKKFSICGTFEYMSPEIAHTDGHDLKTDVWSLGVLLYEFIHGPLIRHASLLRRKPSASQAQRATGSLQVPSRSKARNPTTNRKNA